MNELVNKKSNIAKQMRDLLNAAKNEQRGLTAEEKSKYDAMLEDFENIEETIKREQDLQQVESRSQELEQREFTPEGTSQQQAEHRDMDREEIRSFFKGELSDFNKRENRAMSSTTGETGGYMVPERFSNQLKEYLQDLVVVRQLATVETWDGEGAFPVVNDFGTTYLVGENEEVDETEPGLDQAKVSGYQLMYKVNVPLKLIENSKYNLEDNMMGWWAKSRAPKEEQYFVTGTGNGQPIGLLEAGEDGPETASNSSLEGDDLLEWFYSLHAGYRNMASWIFNDSTVKMIRKLKTPVESSGSQDYLWLPGLGGEPDTLLGRPIYPSSGFPTFAAGEKIGVFGDISEFMVVDFASPRMIRDPYTNAGKAQIRFVGWQLLDTALPVAEAVKTCRVKS